MIQIMEFLDGIFSIVFVSVTILVGINIILTYFKHKHKDLIYVGITWIVMACAYLPPAINFFTMVLFNTPFNEFFYLSIYGVLPISILMWNMAIMDLSGVKENIQRLVSIIILILCLIAIIVYYAFLITDPSLIGTFINPFIVQFTLFARLYFIACLFGVIIPGIIFAVKSMRSENPEIKLKGKLLLLAFISFTIGVILTSSVPEMTIKVIARIILVTCSIEFYMGYFLNFIFFYTFKTINSEYYLLVII
ncbi:MAG: hypothetical protein ACFFAO_21525 [Candidatus Hermodarchaeota archaeon]